jgi:hypothetical protein
VFDDGLANVDGSKPHSMHLPIAFALFRAAAFAR